MPASFDVPQPERDGGTSSKRLAGAPRTGVSASDLPAPLTDLHREILAAPPGSRLAQLRRLVTESARVSPLVRAVFGEDAGAQPDFSRNLLSSPASVTPLPTWPRQPSTAFHGLAGDFVRLIEPHTEADPAGLLVQFLVAYGNAIGRGAHVRAESDRHHGNLFAVLVGRSSKGRKGTSLGHVRRVFEPVDSTWNRLCLQTGLSSGEGLINAVRDANGEDKGAADKRLLALQPEFSALLRVMGREGNTLSALLRDAWDGGRLQTLTRANPLVATDAHISLIGHITADELRGTLTSTQAGNGFANRFLWVCVQRARELPDGGEPEAQATAELAQRLGQAVDFGATAGLLVRDAAAHVRWHAVYSALSGGHAGLFGAITSRAEGQVVRLALLYALLDLSNSIRLPHLEAALDLWAYCEASARYIFGEDTGNRDADIVLAALQARTNGLTRGEIFVLFHNRRSAGAISRALVALRDAGLAECRVEQTRGRPAERWLAKAPPPAEAGEERRIREKSPDAAVTAPDTP